MIGELTVENFKRIKAVTIRPNRSVVHITGRNESGKSSILDAVVAVLGGKGAEPVDAVRHGEETARVLLTTDQYRVEKTWDKHGKSKLHLTSLDGKRSYDKSQPQTLLEQLFPGIGFDPMAFERMSPTDQGDTFRQLLGLDFTTLNAEYDKRYAIRTGVNGRIRDLDGQLKAMPTVKAPDKEVSLTALADEIADAGIKNAARERLIAGRDKARVEIRTMTDRIVNTENELARLKEQCDKAEAEADRLAGIVRATAVIDSEPLRVKLKDTEATNVLVRRKKAKAEKQAEIWALEAESNKLTERLDAIKAEKTKQIAACPMPVPGLGFDDDGLITMVGENGERCLFKQCASSQRIRTSTALGIKMNPGGIMCVYDASMLDTEHLAMFEKMAEGQLEGGTVFIERATDGKEEAGFVIEEGELKE